MARPGKETNGLFFNQRECEMNVAFELTGEMPMLMHWDNIEGGDELKGWRGDPANKNISVPGDDRSPPWTWQTYCYSDGEHVAVPSENLMACLRQAGAKVTLKKQKTFKESSQSGLLIPTEFCDFKANGKQIPIASLDAMRDLPFKQQAESANGLGFSLFMRRARVGQAKHVRVRPRFDQWSISGMVRVLVPEITFDILAQLFDLAGRVGLGDWRPGCKTPGPYGMFTAKIKKCA